MIKEDKKHKRFLEEIEGRYPVPISIGIFSAPADLGAMYA
jgi:hypothetical protein